MYRDVYWMAFQLQKLIDNHNIPISDKSKFTLSSVGCLIALVKKTVCCIYKLNGDIVSIFETNTKKIKHIYWIDDNIIFITRESVKMFNIKERSVVYEAVHIIKGSNRKNNMLVLAIETEFVIFDVLARRLRKKKIVSYLKALSIFGCIYPVDYKPKVVTEEMLMLKKLRMPIFKIKNENINTIIPENMRNEHRNVGRKLVFCKKSLIVKNRSVIATYRNSKLVIRKNKEKKKTVFEVIRSIVLLRGLLVFTTRDRLFVYDFKKLNKVNVKNAFLYKIRSGVFVINEQKIILIEKMQTKNKFVSTTCQKSGILYRNEKIHTIINMLRITKNYEEILQICAFHRLRMSTMVDEYLKLLICSGETDVDLISKAKKILERYKYSFFYEIAVYARKYNRILFAQFLISRERNYLKKVDFIVKYKDNNFLSETIKKEHNHIFLHHLFSRLRSTYSTNDILSAIRDEDSLQKYKNYVKHFDIEYLEFMKKMHRTDELYYYNLEHGILDSNIHVKNKFNTKIADVFRTFYRIKSYISTHYNCNVCTIDQAIAFLLDNNDNREAFALKYASIMCKEKFNHLKRLVNR